MPRITDEMWADLYRAIDARPPKTKRPLENKTFHEEREDPNSALIKPLGEIKEAGLEAYYRYFHSRAVIHELNEKVSKEDADRQALNDTIYKFMEDHRVSEDSVDVDQFIKKMVRI